jgi:hypothetical protein
MQISRRTDRTAPPFRSMPLQSLAMSEATLWPWACFLRAAKARMRPVFGQERRKTGWMRGAAAADPGAWRQQAVPGRGRREADALRDVVRDDARDVLADADAVLVVDG